MTRKLAELSKQSRDLLLSDPRAAQLLIEVGVGYLVAEPGDFSLTLDEIAAARAIFEPDPPGRLKIRPQRARTFQSSRGPNEYHATAELCDCPGRRSSKTDADGNRQPHHTYTCRHMRRCAELDAATAGEPDYSRFED